MHMSLTWRFGSLSDVWCMYVCMYAWISAAWNMTYACKRTCACMHAVMDKKFFRRANQFYHSFLLRGLRFTLSGLPAASGFRPSATGKLAFPHSTSSWLRRNGGRSSSSRGGGRFVSFHFGGQNIDGNERIYCADGFFDHFIRDDYARVAALNLSLRNWSAEQKIIQQVIS